MRLNRMRTILIATLLFIGFGTVLPAANAQAWANGYSSRRIITVDHTKVLSKDQTNFPILISGTYSDLATTGNGGSVTNTNGFDIIFTSDAGGTSVLAFEQESYNPSTGAVTYWVNIPALSHSVDIVIYLFYGNSSVTTDQSNKTGVWSSNFAGVWHFPNGVALTGADSTSNANNATVHGAGAASGVIGGGASFTSSSSQYISAADSTSLKPTSLTFSFWMKRSGNQQQYAHLIVKGAGAAAPWGSYVFQLNDSGSDSSEASLFFGTTDNLTPGAGYPSGSFADGTWYYVVGTFDASSKVASGYKNGQLIGSSTAAVGTISYDTAGLFFGHQPTFGQYFNGAMDEVRVSNVARSAEWIATEYNNESSPSTFYSVGSAATGASTAPTISGLSPSLGAGASVTITGTKFGSSQGSSTVKFNGATIVPTTWSDTSIVAPLASRLTAASITVVATVGGSPTNSVSFTEQPSSLGSPWNDADIGAVPLSGNYGYSNGLFEVSSAAGGIWNAADTTHFVYQPLSGDGAIVARVAGLVNGGANQEAGVMIRETLDAGSKNVYIALGQAQTFFIYRATTGGTTTGTFPSNSATTPYWVKLVRSGSAFSGYASTDGVNWTQIGTTQTISMSTNVYVGLSVASGGSTLANAITTATIDAVSITSSATTPPAITGISSTTGPIGAVVVIGGSGFGASQGTSGVFLNDASATIDSWTDTSITIVVPPDATTGPLFVAIAPGMNASNRILFTVESPSLPATWLDQDIGITGLSNGASYSSGVFTVNAAAPGVWSTADTIHFVYQPLAGDGTIVARVTGLASGTSNQEAGVMIRETLDPASKNAYMALGQARSFFIYRASTGGTTTGTFPSTTPAPPYWVKLVRSGSAFSGYASTDGITWTQLGTPQTVSMATNAYVGLAVASGSNSNLSTATFDNVSVVVPFVNSGTFIGTVIRASDSSVVNGATVKAMQYGSVKATTFTGDGNYELPNLPAGNYDIQVSASGLGTALTSGVFLPANSATTVNFTLSSPGSISGTVTQSGGSTPISGATVRASVGSALLSSVVTNSSGIYTISGLSAGSYAVQASASGYVAGVQSEAVTASSTTTANFSLQSQSTGAVSYVYDGLGRLVGVTSPSGDTAIYHYDAVGNLLSISRQSTSLLAIITFTPISGPVGTSVTIYGTGFVSDPTQDTVKFNGVVATIQSATPTQLVVTVPTSATTGTVSVTTASGTVTSTASFTVTPY